MIYTWYKLMNITDLDELGLVSKKYNYNFQEIGEKEVFLFKGNYYSVLYEGVFLTYNLNGNEMLEFENLAMTIIDNYVYLGIKVDES